MVWIIFWLNYSINTINLVAMKNDQYLRLWLAVVIEEIPYIHKDLIDDLAIRFTYEDRLPDEESLHFIFSFFGS